MQAIHLAAMDMDGTLLDDRKEVSPATLRALEALREKGIPAAFSTGRALSEVTLYPELTGLILYAILASGALVMDLRTGTVIRKDRLPAEIALKALELACLEDVVPHLLTVTDSVCLAADIERMQEHNMGRYAPMFRRICIKPKEMAAYIREHPDSLVKVNFYHRDPDARFRTEQRLKALPLQLVHAEYSSLECTVPGVAKDTGLAALCGALGTELCHVLAVGDSDNDLPMLKAAGLSVAMGNAPEDIRAAADFVTADNNHDGVAEALKRFLPFMTPPEGTCL